MSISSRLVKQDSLVLTAFTVEYEESHQPVRFSLGRDMRVLFLLFVFSMGAHASPYFQDCSKVLPTQHFRALTTYLTGSGGLLAKDNPNTKPNSCFRLNDQEFVVIPQESGAAFGNLYYCDFRRSKGCREYFENGLQMPNLEVVREFSGWHGKRYVLMESSFLEHGISDDSFLVLSLVPANVGPPFFVQVMLNSTGEDGGLCAKGDFDTDIAGENNFHLETTSIIKFEGVAKENSADVTLKFSGSEGNCKNGHVTAFRKYFSLHDGSFKEADKQL